MVLRIRYSSDKAIYKLGKKFGCLPNTEATELLKLAKSLNLNVIGISFHIGSSCEDYESYCGAIAISRALFQFATDIGYKFRILDIGGMFKFYKSLAEKIDFSFKVVFPAIASIESKSFHA